MRAVPYPLSLLLNVPAALLALLAGLLVILLDGRLAGRAGSYRVGELVRSGYLLVPLLLAVLNPLLGVLGGAGSALLAHRRGRPEQRNLPAAFSLSLLLLVGYPAFLFVLAAQNSVEPRDIPRPEGPERLSGVALQEIEDAARSFGLECTNIGEGPVLALCRAGPEDEAPRYEVGMLGESAERVGIVDATVRGCDAAGFDRARAVGFLGGIASASYEDQGEAAEAQRWVERNASSEGSVKTEGGRHLNLTSGCEEAGVMSLSVHATGYVPGGYPPEGGGGIEGGLLGLIVTPLFVASSFSFFFLTGGPFINLAVGGAALLAGVLAGVSLGYLVVRSPRLRKPFAVLAALVLAVELALILASPEQLLTAGATTWRSERLIVLSAVPWGFALGLSLGFAFAAVRGLTLRRTQ